MTYEELLYLLPYLLSLSLSFTIFVYSWQHRHVRGAGAYALYIGAVTATIFGFIAELVSPSLQSKIIWDQFQWLMQMAYVVAYLRFAFQYAEVRLPHPRRTWGLLIAFPLLFTILALTDGFHHLIYPNPHLSTDYPFTELKYDLSTIIYVYALYGYATTIYAVWLLCKRGLQHHGIYRRQYITIAVGMAIPIVFSVFILADVRLTPQRDNTPFTFVLGNSVIAWGLFRYKVFDIAPIARERIVDNMNDPVVVLDVQNRVVDVNRAALTLIGKRESELMGQTYDEAFARWPIVVEMLADSVEQRREISAKSKGELYYFDVSISTIRNQENKSLGRIVVARDITRHKYMEMNYRALSEELEQRVHERTEELNKAAEQYRIVVDHQTEFIVHWKPDGTRTFVNEAYRRYFGLTAAEAMTVDFMTLIPEEDRPAVEHKISRLLSGEADSILDVHRVLLPDGSWAWQEWVDQPIRDSNGNVVEFQSIGRDITERKLAEEKLQKSEERFSKAFWSSPTIMILSRFRDAMILEVNETFEKVSGYTRAEVVGRSTMDLGIWVQADDRARLLSALVADKKFSNEEIQFRIKGGRILTALVAADLIELDGETCILGTIQDISERKLAEARIVRLNHLYVTISQINQTIVHARDEDTLFNEICRVAVEHGQFRMAWVGLLNRATGLVKPAACAGEESGYLAGLAIQYDDQSLRDSPIRSAMREGRCIVCQDIEHNPVAIHWRDAALQRGYRSTAVVPLRRLGHVSGILAVYSHEPYGFDTESEQLLEQIGLDVSFALDSINAEHQRQIAEQNLAIAYDTTLEGWSRALELRDKETEGHSRRVTATTLIVARAMGFNEEELVHIRYGSLLHDIGKMGISDEILRKNGPLNEAEKLIVQKHPTTAYELLKTIPYLEKALEIPYSHHEKWDGSGYPRGLSGEQIPLSARIFAVVDVWDALSSDRPYRPGWEQAKVVEYLQAEAGTHFDPQVVDVFLQLLKEGKI